MSSLVIEVEGLYEGVVTQPEAWSGGAIEDWATTVGRDTTVSRTEAKELRRVVRTAQRLRDFWIADDRRGDVSIEWRSRVDIAMGPRAWRPVLALAGEELDATPSYESFERVSELFQVVNNVPFMEGGTYEAWLEDHGANGHLG